MSRRRVQIPPGSPNYEGDFMSERFKQFLEYIENTGGNAKKEHFIEDWEPIGGRVLEELADDDLVYMQTSGCLALTEKGKDLIK